MRPRQPTRIRSAPALVALLLAAGLAGCGGSDGEPADPGRGVGGVRVGSVAPLAQCRDWLAADDAQRLATIDDIRERINTGDPGVENPTLTDEQAADVFDGACRHPYAAGFRLYKLYFRAAAFSPLVPGDE